MTVSKHLAIASSTDESVVHSGDRLLSGVLSPLLRRLTHQVSPLFGVLVLVGVWYLIAAITPKAVLPYPHLVFVRVVEWFWEAPPLAIYGLQATGLGPNIFHTMQTVLLAQVLGLVVGSSLGLLSARVPLLRAALNPVVLITTTIPILVFAPFFLVWFGVGRLGGMMLVTLYATNLFVIYSQRGAENLDPVYENNARVLGAGRIRVLRDVLVPGTIPEIIGGLRISLAGAWGLAAITELLGAREGTGVVMRVLVGQFDVVGIFAAIVLISTAALLFDWLVVVASKHFIKWRST